MQLWRQLGWGSRSAGRGGGSGGRGGGSGGAKHHEDGQVLAPILVALLAIVGLGVALTAVARSHTLAARAQTAADAAALAALDGAEANLVDSIRHSPYAPSTVSGGGCGLADRQAASRYAVANDAVLDSCDIDGARATVKVQSRGTVDGAGEAEAASASGVRRAATAELVVVWKTGDRPQSEPPNPPPTVESLHNEARRSGGELLTESGLLRISTCAGDGGRPLGAGIAVGVRAALRAAEQRLAQPVNFRPGWTEPCHPPSTVSGRPILVDQWSVLRVANPALLASVLGPEVPLCQPYPAHPDHFALAREPVCGGRHGVLTSAFPTLDRLVETKRILVG